MLLQLEPGFNIRALNELITTEIVDAAILKAEVKREAGQKDVDNTDANLVVQEGNIEGTMPNAGDIEAVEMAPTKEGIEVVEVVPTEENTEPPKVVFEEVAN